MTIADFPGQDIAGAPLPDLLPLPSTTAQLRDIATAFAAIGAEGLSPDYRELHALPDRMVRLGENTVMVFRQDDMVRLGSNALVANLTAEDFARTYYCDFPEGNLTLAEIGNVMRMHRNMFFTSEPAFHGAFKRVIAQPLMPKHMPPFRAMFTDALEEVIGELAGTGPVDLVRDVMEQVAIRFWCSLLDMSRDEGNRALDAIRRMGPLVTGQNRNRDGILTMEQAVGDYFDAILPALRRALDSGDNAFVAGIAHRLAAAPDLDDAPESLEVFLAASILDGYHAIAVGAASTVLDLIERPALLAAVRADPALVSGVASESLRLHTPVTAITRIFLDDLEYDGMTFPKGTHLLMYWAASNRDPRALDRPNDLVPERPLRPGVTFGAGAQLCPGRSVAHTFAVAAGVALTRPGVSVELAGEPVWEGPSSLPPTVLGRCPVRIAIAEEGDVAA